MTALVPASSFVATAPDARRTALADRLFVVVLIGFGMSFALSWPRLLEVWNDNTFFDTDDAMRLVQVRTWLQGQGWFDLVEHRLFPPAGLLMHWSRIVDVPVGGLIRLFGLFTTPDLAERLARIVFPLALQVALVVVTVATARVLLGPSAMVPGMLLIVLSGFAFEQFPAGRIDHHAPQITLLMGMTGTILAALSPVRAWTAAVAGLCIAVSVAISLENLPFIAVIVAVLPLAWVFEPARVRNALLWLAASLVVAVPALFVATIPPARYADGVCDAFSVAHLAGLLAGAGGLAGLALLSSRLRTPSWRVVALAAVGIGVVGLMLVAYPACLHDPYAGMDPLLQTMWLNNVTEAQPLLAASRARPDTFTVLFCPLVCGGVAAGIAVWGENGMARARWAVVLALTLVGLAGTFWEIRIAASTQPLAVLGGTWAVTTALEAARRRGSTLGTILAFVLILPFATLAWAFVPTGGGDASAAATLAQGQACRTSAALAPLGTLPASVIFAPIDDGSHLLVATRHSVVAAPYHRNQRGNRLVLDGFMAPPEDAAVIVRRTGARYVAICPGEVQIAMIARVAPNGLGARLVAGQPPDWLTPVPLADTPYRVFAVRGE